MSNVLHLSHTDIQFDSRILKEMTALANSSEGYQLVGIGVKMSVGSATSSQAKNIEIHSINLNSKVLTFLPNVIRRSLTLIELVVKAFYKAVKVRPDIIHCHDTVVLPLGVLVKIFTRSRLIYDAHELESDKNGLGRMLSRLTLYAEKISWPFINLLITVSPSIKQWYHENLGPKVSEVILNSPVLKHTGLTQQTTEKDYFRNRFDIPETSKIFIYVGILAAGRGLEYILEAFSSSSCKSHVVFLGYGDLSEQVIERCSTCENIHYHEAVPHENVVEVIQNADVGLCLIENVSLSDYYCLPNKLFEYSFAGIPVVASNFPDIREMVEKYNLGVCCDLDPNSIKVAIGEFERRDIINGIDTVGLYDVSWEAQGKKLLDAYHSLER